MQSRCRHSLILCLAAAAIGFAATASADVPDWVPPQYVKFFTRSVDERPAWEKALDYLNVQVGETGKSFALVAGISNYPNMSGRERDLFPARLDVEKMASYLAGEPESFNEIVVLLDEDMTPENLRFFLTRYFPRRLSASPRSRFLFAYSGHGMTDENDRGYLLTGEATSLKDWFNGISLSELRAQFQAIVDRGHQVLVLINACYGVDFHRGLSFGGEDDLPIAPKPTREGAHAITAGGSGEVSWHDPNFPDSIGPKGSIFFEAVLQALDGRADKFPEDGIVSVGELQAYLHGTVSRFTEENQNPTGSDLKASTSPGGFYFLDRDRQMANGNAEPLTGTWWSGLAFGGGKLDRRLPDAAEERPGDASSPASRDVASTQSLGELDEDRDLLQQMPITSPPTAPLVRMAGRWRGTAEEPGGFQFPVEVEIVSDCWQAVGTCGTIAVPHVPCRGKITLLNILEEGAFEFDVSDFDASSDKTICQPGAGEVLKPLPDGTLSYTATYSGATGVLTRQ
jgi:hypothetical protein